MKTFKPVLYLQYKEKPFEVDIVAMQEPEAFDLLLRYLQNNFNARVIDSYDGWDVSRRTLSIDGIQFNLLFDAPFGNSLVAVSENSEELLRRIGEDLEDKLEDLKDYGSNYKRII